MQQISPAEIGLRVDYDSKNWTPWNPDKWVIHYGGGPVSDHNAGPTREMAVLRAWEWWHLNGQGWLGIAYNYAIGQSGKLYRLRGEQRSGATSGDADSDGIPENHEARAVVFILGGDQKPSPQALATFSKFWATDPMPVIGHRDSTDTPCPGDHLYDWIQSKGYEETPMLPINAQSGKEPIRHVQEMLGVAASGQWDFVEAVQALAVRSGTGDPAGKAGQHINGRMFTQLIDERIKWNQAGLVARMEDWVRAHVKTAIAAAIAAGAGSAQIDYGQLVQEIGRVLTGG